MSTDPVLRIVEQWGEQRPDLDASSILVVGRLARVEARFDAVLRRPFADEGLGNGDFDVLAALRRSGSHPVRPAELSRMLLVGTGAITKRLNRLEAQGHVVRDPDVVDDGRGKLVRLTPSGRRFVDRMMAVHLANEQRLLTPLTRGERDTLARLLAKLDAGLA